MCRYEYDRRVSPQRAIVAGGSLRGLNAVLRLRDLAGCDVTVYERSRTLFARTREAGRRAQFEGAWKVGDPLPFGLYETGDSEVP